MKYTINLREKKFPYRTLEVFIYFETTEQLCSYLVAQACDHWLISLMLVPAQKENPLPEVKI